MSRLVVLFISPNNPIHVSIDHFNMSHHSQTDRNMEIPLPLHVKIITAPPQRPTKHFWTTPTKLKRELSAPRPVLSCPLPAF